MLFPLSAARAAEPRHYHLGAQDAATGLRALALQGDFQLFFTSELVKGRKIQAVHGNLTPAAALEAALKGTGLRFSVTAEQTYVVESDSAKTPAAGAKNTGGVREPPSITESATSLRLAQANTEDRGEARHPHSSQAAYEGNRRPVELEEVIVTGSHIRGSQVAGSRIITIDRQYIDKSGYARIEDVLAELPQSFRGIGEEFSQQVSNLNMGAEIQLRGLGPGTTLTLVNGHRQPAGGLRGAFVDISSIPLAAVERVEILTDGASAIYGSDAVGGVVNIILRKSWQGAESRVRLATAQGEGGETQFSQIFGGNWASGSALVGYQYSKRADVPAAARDYVAANGDLRAYGGSDFRTLFRQFSSNPGTILCPPGRTDCTSGSPAFAIPSGQDGTDLSVSNLIPGSANYTDNVTSSQILPRQQLHSAFFNVTQGIGDRWELFSDGRYGERDTDRLVGPSILTLQVPASNPFYVNPFGGTGPVRVAYDFARDLGPLSSSSTTRTFTTVLGATGKLGGGWQLQFNGSYGREDVRNLLFNYVDAASPAILNTINAALADPNPATALNVFGDGSNTNPSTLAAIAGRDFTQAVSSVWSAGAIADGPVFDLPGGSARLAVGVDYRDESQRTVARADRTSTISRDLTSDRTVKAVFAELAVPIVGRENARSGLRALEVSVAGRHEQYSDFGSTFDPRLGVSYLPWSSLRLRGTWGTSFRAPPFFQLDERLTTQRVVAGLIADPTSPTGSSRVLRLFGNNRGLKEETADVWTAGLDLSFAAITNLTISLTYSHIDYKDKIQVVSPSLAQESQFADLIRRNPSQADVDAACSAPGVVVLGDCSGTFAAILDVRQRNVAVLEARALDLDAGYTHDSRFGTWSYGVGGSHTFSQKRAVTETSPMTDIVNTVENPLALRLRGNISWSRGGFAGGLTLNYSNSYDDPATVPATPVDSWTTADVSFSYEPNASGVWLQGTRFSLNAVNVLDERPPFVNQFDGYDGANASILGRLLSFQLLKAW